MNASDFTNEAMSNYPAPTPRTDAAKITGDKVAFAHLKAEFVPAEKSAELERELAELNQAHQKQACSGETLEQTLSRLRSAADKMEVERDQLRQQLAETQSEVVQMGYAMAGMKQQLAAAMKVAVCALRVQQLTKENYPHRSPEWVYSHPDTPIRLAMNNLLDAVNGFENTTRNLKDQTK